MASDSEPTFNLIMNITNETVMLIGLVGNILTFMVFSRATFKKNSISIYCRALAISDSFIAYQATVYLYNLIYNYYLGMYSDAACKIINYIRYGFGSIPGWILIGFAVDKILNLKKIINGMKRPIVHYIIIFVIALVNLLIYIEVPIYIGLVPVKKSGVTVLLCDPSLLSFAFALNIIYIIEGSALPFGIMVFSSFYTIKLLRDSRRQVNMTGVVADKRKNRDIKFTVTSLTFNVLFIVLKLPFVLCFAIGPFNVSNYFLQSASLLFSIYFSMGFFIHYAANSIFRREFLIMLRIRKPLADSNMTQTNQTNRMTNLKLPLQEDF